MKKVLQKSLALVLLLGIGAVAQAQERVYVIDQRGEVVTSGAGLCWRTGYWTPAAAANDPAGCQCDRDLMPAAVCDGAAAPAAPARPEARVAPDAKVTLAADALFDFNKAELRPEGRAKLDEVAARANQINLEVIIAVGHTDRIGGSAYNQRLSERRAAAVKDYLVSQGVAADRVYTEGRGKTQPVTGDACDNLGREHGSNKKLVECLQPDRRVDIELIGTTN
ncbi:MAG: OmpA family protein [Betaproteobacteria bacterium]|nr:OmpA family protein [Betaproteobacteria bacterium]